MHLTRQQSRDIDTRAIHELGIPGMVLMENAGRGVVDVLLELEPQLAEKSVAILCGKGNNGGDGFVIARHLEIRGVASRVILLAAPDELQGDALANYEILQHTRVPIVDLSKSSSAELASTVSLAAGSAWIIDALLGTGAQGDPREPYAMAIEWMNAQPARRLAVDVPSGLDCDTGQAATPTVRAEHTCTFVAAKAGFKQPAAGEFLGQLHVVSIGLPPSWIDEVVGNSGG